MLLDYNLVQRKQFKTHWSNYLTILLQKHSSPSNLLQCLNILSLKKESQRELLVSCRIYPKILKIVLVSFHFRCNDNGMLCIKTSIIINRLNLDLNHLTHANQNAKKS